MSLLRDIHGLIERTYATASGIADLGPWLALWKARLESCRR